VLRAVRAAFGYAALSCWLFRDVLAGLSTRAPLGAGGDVAQMCWFLARTARAVTHGQNLFVAHEINAPVGVNLMWNTAMLPVGVLMSPVTLRWGPITSFNIVMLLAPVATAIAGRWWLSRHVDSELARWVGGVAIGFSPFVSAHLGGHLNFVLLPLVPVILRLLEDVLWRHPRSLPRAAVLGLVLFIQALLSEEVVILLAVGTGLAAVLFFLERPRDVVQVRPLLPRLGVAAAVATLLLAWPLAVQLLGPDRVSGVDPSAHHAQLRDLVVPSTRLALGSLGETSELERRGTSRFEDATYVGVPALLLLAGTVVAWRGRRAVRVAAGTAVLAFVLALGNGGQGSGDTGLSHPAGFLLAIPGLSSVAPQRFGLVLDLCLAWLLAQVCEALVLRKERVLIPAGALVAATLVSWMPASPEQQVDAGVPAFFTSDEATSLAGQTVVLLPAPHRSDDRAMLYQAAAGLPFRMVGGYALTVDRRGRQVSDAPADPVTQLAGAPGTPSVAQVCAARRALLDDGVDAVAVVRHDDAGGRLAAAAATVLGGPGRELRGVELWQVRGQWPCPAGLRTRLIRR
jgi:hypothetical protein